MQNQSQLPPLLYSNPKSIGSGQQPQYQANTVQGVPDTSQTNYQIPIVQPYRFPIQQVYQSPPTNQQPSDHHPLKEVIPDPSNNYNPLTQPSQQPQLINPGFDQNLSQRPLDDIVQPNVNFDNQNQTNFLIKMFVISGAFIVLFGAEIFIERYLLGYVVTYQLYVFSHLTLFFANVQTFCGKKGRCCHKVKRQHYFGASQLFLVLFFALQISALVFAVKYPLRYQFNNPDANDAMSDYTDYYASGGDYKCDSHRQCTGTKVPEVYTISETCRVLQNANGIKFSSKSYAAYCLKVLNGTEDDIDFDELSPIQIGLIFYFAFGLLVSFIISVYFFRQLHLMSQELYRREQEMQQGQQQRDSNKIFQQKNYIKGANPGYSK